MTNISVTFTGATVESIVTDMANFLNKVKGVNLFLPVQKPVVEENAEKPVKEVLPTAEEG